MLTRHYLSISLVLATIFVTSLSLSAQKRQHHRGSATRVQLQPAEPASHSEATPQQVYDLWFVDEEPRFPGGERGLLKYINAHREYPQEAYENGISGRVLCSFTISSDGTVSDVQVIRSVEASLDREAVRVISSMPRWIPAVVSDQAVPVHYVLPIPFRL